MEPTLSRLTRGAPDCGAGFEGSLCPDNALYRRLMSQFATAIAAPVTSPAQTLGYGGFYVGIHASVTGVDAGREYWQRGTVGGSEAAAEGANLQTASSLVWTRAEVRKGLPFGMELAGTVGHGGNTGLWSVGGSLKLALLEGFREGLWGHLPDVSVRVALETLVGSRDIHLTVPSLDWTISKPFAFAGSFVFTPLAGLQTAWIVAESGIVDFRPDQNARAECMPLPGHQLPRGEAAGGAIQCDRRGNPSGYANHGTFDAFRATRWRGFVGAQLQHSHFRFTVVAHMDLLEPEIGDGEMPERLPRQFSILLGGGVGF